MSLTVKVYLEKGDGGAPEIRRFALDQDVSTSFAYVQKKIAQVFPGLETQPFCLYWKDIEGDYITFSSDAELFEALSQLGEDIFRVYVRVSGKCGESGGEKAHHEGVVCDGCEGGVYGSRYKCTMCPDYDLCETCEGKGLHGEHHMIRIRTPGQAWMGFLPPHCRRGRRGGPWHHHGHHGPHGHGPHGPKNHGPDAEGQGPTGADGLHMPPHFGRWMRHAMKNFWQFPAGGAQEQNTDNEKNESKTQPGEGKDKQKGAEQCNQSVGADYLRTVGETVAAMLDPMGIDVEIDVEHGDTRTRCGKGRTCQGAENKKNDTNAEDVEMQEGRNDQSATDVKQREQTTPEPKDGSTSNKTGGNNHTDSEWTFLQSGATAPSNSQSGASAVYPSLPTDVDPRVAELLTQMESMGFTNEDGWLTNLIISKQGDIGKVLDALQPPKNA